MRFVELTIHCLLVLASITASAEDAKPLSLKDAEAIALQKHPRITAAELRALASKQVTREARSAYYPTITGNATLAGGSGNNTRIAAGGLNNPLILDRNAEGINVNQLIYDFGRTANLTASSELRSRAEEENALATRAQIVLQVDAAYFDALQAQSVLGVANQTVATRQTLFDQINELANNKLKSGLDVSFARVSLEEGKLLLAKTENDLQGAFASLAALLGDRDQQQYHLLDTASPASLNMDQNQLVEKALQNRPDLARLRFEKEAAKKFARAEKDLHYPTINAMGSAGIIPLHDSKLNDNYAAAGINVSLPIFDGFLFSARAKEAELRAKAVEATMLDEENNIVRDVKLAALNLNYAAERVTLTGKLVESANDAFDLAQARYKVGSSSIVELSQAQLAKTEAEIAQARAKYEYQVRKSVLSYQTGEIK
ncbi:TolC family protein [Pedosphaera parvula]|uniref:Outer membrane efflux protein n=1 Tax=Pedosphaera parvula (strain Ellin514) TaxID=320771 RepID=B9XF76_PEDPL|nr:TolC family protein [Pedosphaera parvula]EEF61574.1 outer membrane efflux protein [Pedosphaera parvula Ellin514]